MSIWKKLAFIPLLALCLVLLITTAVSCASAAEFSISPEKPSPGDTVTLTGKASPNEDIPVSISFSMDSDVSDGKYIYSLESFTLPKDLSSISMKAVGVNDLKIEVKLPVVGYTAVPEKYIKLNGNVASFGTSKLKEGTYGIRLSGSADDATKVKLVFDVKGSITADADGNFAYTYNTAGMPEGDYSIKAGGKSQPLHLGAVETGSSGSQSGGSQSSTSRPGKGSGTSVKLDVVNATVVAPGYGETDVPVDTGKKTNPDNYVEGVEMTQVNQTNSGGKVPHFGLDTLLIVIGSIGAILIGFRMNRIK